MGGSPTGCAALYVVDGDTIRCNAPEISADTAAVEGSAADGRVLVTFNAGKFEDKLPGHYNVQLRVTLGSVVQTVGVAMVLVQASTKPAP